MLSSKVQ